ncbi:Bug family tripartite tricarboxylate transporter substrate binding protein [Paracraurococcus lichenis]|uniref:Tripartite tricarboxylate transporter substrate binding protein n=1 Tax=Paracraurococcus lichenis TaxID=3064888 RepID=A0ABT9DT51_9PROT|nr:tripartite tricarboxylate transporter substrate binding protein [Paracraurococcus sp. LOR1-02]MDO9707071.1 tripartite tricarboxylate transporter substrate binding protein [Paracraurococcus sp. LOR1-02]
MPTRRSLLAAAATLPLARAARAERWAPDRPLRLVAPFPPGGASDLVSRMLVEELGPALGQPIAVENRAGAGGAIGTEAVVRARPDGLTLLMGSQATHATNPALNPGLAFDPMRDTAVVAGICGVPAVLVVHPGVPARTVQDLVAMARAKPGELRYGSAGIGASTHLAAALFAHLAGIELTHVPYRGTGPAMQDLLGGRIEMLTDTLPTSLPHIQAGRLRALGVSTAARSASLPEVPTLAEAGVEGYEALNWYAVYAPAGTPEPALARLHAEIAAAVARPRFQERLAQQGMLPFPGSREELAAYAAADRQRWTALVQATGIKPD